MIYDCNGCKYCINCDWLQFSVTLSTELPELYCPEGFRLEVLPGNNIFRHRVILWHNDGDKFATLLWSPYSSLINKYIMTVQFDNHVLYRSGIMTAWRLIQEIVPCEYRSSGRIDVCCDFQVDKRHMQIIRQLWDGSMYVQRKSEGSCWWHSDKQDGSRFVHCLSWGSKNTEIKVKLYNKSRELGVDDKGFGDKQYIIDEWMSAGFDVKKVWRLEFSMCSSGTLRWDGKKITLEDVTLSKWISDVFCTLYEKRFVVRYNDGKCNGHHNDDRKVVFLTLTKSDMVLSWIEGTQDDKPSMAEITMLRKLISMLDMRAAICSPASFTIVADAILGMCENRSVLAYFKHYYGSEPNVFLEDRFANCGDGVHEVEPKISEIYL